MLIHNGVGVGITEFPYRKKPCLYIYNAEENELVKVASFNSDKTAEWFKEKMLQFFEGFIDVKEKNEHTGREL